jgi:cytochrome c biogenesis protein CcmG/thiol:disulfide interchange protein DsbE
MSISTQHKAAASATTDPTVGAGLPSRRRALLLVPGAVFAGVATFLGIGLTRTDSGLPSPLIGKPVPDFDLPPVQGRLLGLSDDDLMHEVSLVNVFASWCVACRDEHPIFMELKRTGFVPVHGINYMDRPQDAAAWLDEMGDPYTRTGADQNARVSIEWGVYGVPETFLVDAGGIIRHKHIGAVTEDVLEETLRPLILELRG